MEPKDLKNPEGLKSTENEEKEISQNPGALNETEDKEQKVEKTETEVPDEKAESPLNAEENADNQQQIVDVTDTSAEPDVEKDLKSEDSSPGVEADLGEKTEKPSADEGKPDAVIEPESEEVTAKEDKKGKAKESRKPKSEEPVLQVESDKKDLQDDKDKKVEDILVDEGKEDELISKIEESAAQDEEKGEKLPEDSDAESPEKNDPPKEEELLAAPVVKKDKPRQKEVKKSETVHEKKEKPDYAKFTQIELVNALRDVLDSNGDHDIKDEVENIKAAFYKQVKDETEAQKKLFLEEGGDEDEFEAEENPYEQDIKDLLKRYRQIRHEFNKKLEQEKEINLQVKYDIIEEIKGLIHKEESINKTFQDFKDLQQRWREIGLVPQSKMKDLWDTYHFHVENFYDYIKINKELRDLDLKKNLEMKIRLCEQAEELLLEPNTIRAFNQLQKLHERWREIGPVPRENKDDIWERFKASTAKINKKQQDYFEDRKLEQKKNLEAKRALCEQVEEINEMDIATHREWGEKSKEVVNLQRIWRTIGFAPRKDNNKIYKRFREACDSFFDAKREFYNKNKELQQNNLQLKLDLCMQAEALKESDDWRKTTQELINIQKQWKEIGPVPRKNSEALWKRFRAACDYFFDKKSEHFSSIDSEQVNNLKEKEKLIKEVEGFKSTGNPDENLKILKDFQRRWTEVGHVPIRKKDDIQKKFRDAINKLFDDLNIDETKRNLLKFRTKMASFSESSRGQNKMRLERDKYMTKLKQLENDLVLLDNNIGFFAKSKNAETLIEDVKRKIEQTREKIEMLKDKIRVIDEMDLTED